MGKVYIAAASGQIDDLVQIMTDAKGYQQRRAPIENRMSRRQAGYFLYKEQVDSAPIAAIKFVITGDRYVQFAPPLIPDQNPIRRKEVMDGMFAAIIEWCRIHRGTNTRYKRVNVICDSSNPEMDVIRQSIEESIETGLTGSETVTDQPEYDKNNNLVRYRKLFTADS